MDDELVMLASFRDSVQGAIARNALEAAGIRAFLVDDATADTWHLNYAFGTVKLMVMRNDEEAGLEVLTHGNLKDSPQEFAASPEVARSLAQEETEPGESPYDPELVQAKKFDPEYVEDALNEREDNARRALNGAIAGAILFPLQAYVFFALLEVFFSKQPLSPKGRRYMYIAMAINGLYVAAFVVILLAFLFPGQPATRH